jgi:hypothetical protein
MKGVRILLYYTKKNYDEFPEVHSTASRASRDGQLERSCKIKLHGTTTAVRARLVA